MTPYGLLESLQEASCACKPLIAGSEVKEYAAHLIPEGGYKAVPQLFGDGWLIVGDAGQFVNAVHREGSNLAMTTGRLAAEAIFQLKSRRGPMTAENLSLYEKMARQVLRDEGPQEIQAFAKRAATNKHLFGTYPQLFRRPRRLTSVSTATTRRPRKMRSSNLSSGPGALRA